MHHDESGFSLGLVHAQFAVIPIPTGVLPFAICGVFGRLDYRGFTLFPYPSVRAPLLSLIHDQHKIIKGPEIVWLVSPSAFPVTSLSTCLPVELQWTLEYLFAALLLCLCCFPLCMSLLESVCSLCPLLQPGIIPSLLLLHQFFYV